MLPTKLLQVGRFCLLCILFTSTICACVQLGDERQPGTGQHELLRQSRHGARISQANRHDAQRLAKSLQQSRRLDQQLRRAAAHADNDVTRGFLSSLLLCQRCKDMHRYGGNTDGGYVMCREDKFPPVAAYSYGIHGTDDWGMNIAEQKKVPIFEYDCTDGTIPAPCQGCQVTFRKECVYDGKGLAEQLKANGHDKASDGSLIFKMDIEGSEWPIYADPKVVPTFRKVGQLVTELHSLGDAQKHAMYWDAVKNLQAAGLAVVHLHGNNNEHMNTYENYTLPNVLEVTFARTGKPGECPVQDMFPGTQAERLEIDKPNAPQKPDLDPPVLPPRQNNM